MKTLTFNQLTNPSTANRDWNETTSRVLRGNPRPWPYLFRTLLVLFSLLTLSVGQMWAGKNVNWQGKVYFRAPDDWDISTYSTVQMAVARRTQTNVDTYIAYLGTMSRIGTTRLYYLAVNNNHSSWNQNEYVFFSANNSTYGDGTFRVDVNHYYTTPLDYNCNNSTTFYYFNPSSDGNGPTVTGGYQNNGTYVFLNPNQNIYLWANGGNSAAGGSVSITTVQLTGNTTVGSSSTATNSGPTLQQKAAAGSTVTVTATPASGYAFEGWFTSGSGGTAVSTSETYTYTSKAARNLYARFIPETTYTITIANSVNASTSTKSVGATPKQITAPDIAGYRFTTWSAMPSGVTKTSGNLTDASIYISATKAATVTANYEEDLSSPWTLKGGTNLTGNNWSTAYPLTKKTGHSTESVAYYTLSISSTNGGALGSADAWSFKLINGSTWYGLTADGSYWWLRSTSANQTLSTSGQNIQICADVAGDYEIKVDYSTPASPTVTVTFPTSYTLTYSIGSVVGSDGSISTSPSVSSGSYVLSGTNVTLTAPAAKTGYTWKGWYTNAAGTSGHIEDTNRAITVTMNGNKKLYACYTENAWSTTVSAGANGSVTPSGSVDIKQVSGTSIKATPNTGYSFSSWSISGGGITPTTSTSATQVFNATSAGGTITANFSEKTYSVSVKSGNNAFGSVSPSSVSGVGIATTSGDITASPVAGATFTGWTLPTGVTAAAGYTASSNPIRINATAGSKTITANFSETTHTATITSANASHGTVSPASVTTGQITAVQITATKQTGYMFAGWVKTAGSGTVTYHVAAGTGKTVDPTGNTQAITYITIDGDVTLQATWEEDRTSGWYMRGNWTNGWSNTGQKEFVKDVGQTAGTVSHVRWTLAPEMFTNATMQMKMYDGSTYYGHWSVLDADENLCTKDANNTNIGFYSGDENKNFRVSIPVYGEYDFEWDSSTKQLTIHYPAGNFIRGQFNDWDWSAPMSGTGPWTATINLPADQLYATASSGTTGFKYVINGDHYGKNGTITAASRSLSGCTTDGQNMGLATTIGGNYTFTVNNAKTQVTVTYPSIPAMTGSVGLNVTGYLSGEGTSALPYNIFAGESLTLTPTHSSAPAADEHFKYTYYKGAKNASTATTAIETKLSTAASKAITYDVGGTTGKYPLKVSAYYEYGPDGYKTQGTAQSSGIVYYQVWLAPSVTLSSNIVSLKDEASFTLTATPSNVGLASNLAQVHYEFFSGNSTDPANKIGETISKSNGDAVTKTITPDYSSNANSWTYTVKMTFFGIEKTATVTVYRKWDIYVNDVCNWGTMKLYMWDGGGAYPVAFPGTTLSKVTGSTHWYVVTLDTRYPNFKLSKQSGTESNNHVASIVTYPAGTYWYLNNCQTLTQVAISTPTVTISATVTNATQINLTGNITNFGNDGSKASEMREVYFNVNGTKDAAGITASTTDGTFTKALNNPTASASPNNTLQAAATNIGYTGTSSILRFTNITLDKQSGTGGTSAVVAVNGVAMATGATAPTRTGYVFGGYYSEPNGAGTRYFTKTMASAHDWDQTAALDTLYAKWTESVPYTVYFYNKDNWATPTAHLWDVGSYPEAAYPGTAMTVHQGKVYKHDYDFGDGLDSIQFNSGSDANKTADMKIGGNLGDLVTTNQLFYNPEGDGTWTQYIMVAAWPTPNSSTKIKAVVGEKVTVEPVFAWAEGIDLSDISITSSRTTGSSSVNAVIAGTKILVSGTAAGSATFSITYSYGGFSINKTLYVEIVNGLTIQARIAKTDNHWVYNDIVRMHYWGTGIGNSDLTMSWLKSDATYNYYQASVPTGTDGEANFVFYYDYMNDTGTTKWRQTNNIEHVTTEKCYTISFSGNESAHSNCTTSGTGLCVTSWQIQIVMGSGDIFNSNIAESSSDIVSFFAPSNPNEEHTYRQGVVTLEHNGSTVYTYPANTFSASGVYTAKINTDNYGLTDLALYTGDYYIRTDPSAGGWDNYLTEPDNKMTYFNRNTNFPNETFSYYWVDNIAKTSGGSGTVNIKAVVANDYNPMLTVFTPDDNITREEHGINLRFGYEPTTNDIVRGIIRGATNSDFLNLLGETGNVYKTQDCAAAYEMNESYYTAYKDSCKMQDKSNWVYDIFVFAKIDDSHTTADIYLKSNYNGIHYLLGMVKDGFGRDTNEPISFPIIRNDTRTTNGVYRLAIIYDFKTNRLLGAWTPTDLVMDCDNDKNTDANIMFIRHENKDVAQIDFITEECGSTSKITGLQQAILALEVDNDKNASLGNRELHYFVTMPFDCRVGDIFGIPGFMEYWGVQRYNGELRAQIGWFPSTPTFWEWLDENDIMHAGEGYLVSIDKKALQTHNVWKEGIIYQTQDTVKEAGVPVKTHDGLADSVVWRTHTDGSLLTLYFLSTTAGFTIEPASGSSMTISYPNQLCGITSGHRDHQDSNWKCLGTPGYRNVDISAYSATSGVPYYIDDEDEETEYAPPKFLYIFNEQTTSAAYAKGTYTVVDGTDFTYHSFNSYMVQYAGTINWSHYSKGAPAVTPSPIAPRRMPSSAEKQKTKMQLDLLSEENESLDRTFILLREDATKGFDQNYDLNKMVERNANQIYSFAEYDIPFAANALPLETDTVPLVVNIVNAGEYTFSMLKERHYGMTPILYDMFESQQIDLTAADYTVNLAKGKYTDRFYVLFAPVHPIATGIEIMEDGTHHVLSNEAIYDVLGRRVNTVYPQHLYIVNGEKRIMR